jgi:hypothetical protein
MDLATFTQEIAGSNPAGGTSSSPVLTGVLWVRRWVWSLVSGGMKALCKRLWAQPFRCACRWILDAFGRRHGRRRRVDDVVESRNQCSESPDPQITHLSGRRRRKREHSPRPSAAVVSLATGRRPRKQTEDTRRPRRPVTSGPAATTRPLHTRTPERGDRAHRRRRQRTGPSFVAEALRPFAVREAKAIARPRPTHAPV